MILTDWIRGRIPYFRMPPMPNDYKEQPENSINVKQLYNKIFVTSAFSKDDLKASHEENESTPSAPDQEIDSKELSDAQNDDKEDDWDSVFQNVVEPSATEEEPKIESEPDSELEFSEQESIASVSSLKVQKKGPRMTTNKKKVGVHYYESANVKNKNRSKKRLLNPTEVTKRLRKK